jgi:hypothetical protein
MKLAELDWREILATLPEWEALSPAARRAFVEVAPAPGVAASVLGAAQPELVEAGMIAAQGALWVAPPRFSALLQALRTMYELPVLDADELALTMAYVRENLTDDEARRITSTSYSWVDYLRVAQQAWSVDWVEGFLAQPDLRAAARWEAGLVTKSQGTLLMHHGVFEALRALVRSLAGNPGGAPLREILPEADDDTRAAVLKAGFRYLLLFPTLRDQGPEAVVGLSPGAAFRLGPPPAAPEPVEPAESFDAPYLLADMTAVLVELSTAPIPLRGDGAMYARAQTALASRLQPLPAWICAILNLAGAADDDFDDDDDEADGGRPRAGPGPERVARAASAARALIGFGLATHGERGGKRQLSATSAGVRWLQLPEGERLGGVLGLFRGSGQRNPPGWYGSSADTEFFSHRLGFDLPKAAGLDLRAATSAAFLSIPPGEVVPLEQLLRFQAIVANPFLAPGVRKLLQQRYSSTAPTDREGWELLWTNLLLTFLTHRLFAFGGARLARTAEGVPCVGLTPAGRYLLGATDTFEYAPPPEGEVLVQPDFEIVFLAPAPRLEPEVARFTDRIGAGVGALFRITRASAIRAAEQGLAPDEVVGLLERISRGGVPANVARQLRDWMGSTRRVSMRPALLIECPDAETAARVRTAAAKHVEPITATVLRVKARGKERVALVKRLREKGIFVSE